MIIRNEIDWRIITPKDPSDVLRMPHAAHVFSFDEDAVRELSDAVSAAQQSGQSVFPVIIDSIGGDVYSLFSMIDVLASSTVPVATIVEGKAMSAASILAAFAGAKGHRYAAPTATYMIHDVWNWGREAEKTEDLKVSAAETNRLNHIALSFLDKAAQKDAGFFWKKLHELGRTDLYLTPQEAKELNLVDEIGIPSLVTRVSVAQRLELLK